VGIFAVSAKKQQEISYWINPKDLEISIESTKLN
jgi:hypothetical protein